MTIVNDDARVVNKLEASLTEDTRVVIYDCHMFIVQVTSGLIKKGRRCKQFYERILMKLENVS